MPKTNTAQAQAQAFGFVEDISNYKVVEYIDLKPPTPPTPLQYSDRALSIWQEATDAWYADVLGYFRDYQTAHHSVDWSAIKKCTHCGHTLRYVAVVCYTPTQTNLAFGATCAAKLDISGSSDDKLWQAKYRRKAKQREVEDKANEVNYIDKNQTVGAWLFGTSEIGLAIRKEEFLAGVRDNIRFRGNTTPAEQQWVEYYHNQEQRSKRNV